ncbi:MAG TPA: hypothetical protein DCY31_05070 [Ruminococcaceae bacterium]|nr:hypothetical protein [Oscillospiraceae bacterium]
MGEHNVDSIVNECYEKYYQALFKYCMVRLGELNEHSADCVQDAFLILHNKLKAGEIIENPRPFLYKTVGNFIARTIKHYQNERHRTVEFDEAEKVSSPPIISDDFDYDRCALKIIATLTQEEQQLYEMKYIDKKSLEEIAIILDIKPSAVAMRTSRLRRKVKEIIDELNLFGDEVIP